MPKPISRFSKFLLNLIAVLAFLAACAPSIEPPPDDGSDSASPGLATPAPAGDSTPAPPPQSGDYPPVPSAGLSSSGPWYVFAGVDSLWAVNPDGSGLTQIASRAVQTYQSWPSGVAPRGGNLAYIAGDDPFHRLELHLYNLPSGNSRRITSLVAPELEPEGNERVEAVESISYGDSLAWSPDGSQLAFVGAMEGPSSDLYLYSLDGDSITRLTDGDSQTHRLSWSPDGRYILHFGVRTFGTGAGYTMSGAWAAAADDSGVISLYEPFSGDESILGWWDARTAVVYSWHVDCGESRLRTVDIFTKDQSTLWEAYFGFIASDPGSGSIVFTVPSRIARCNPDSRQGVYFVNKNGAAVRILEDDPSDVIWSPEAQLFFVRTEFGVVAVSTGGDWVQLETLSSFFPAANPADKSLAWYGAGGLWLSPLQVTLDGPQPQQVFDSGVKFASWSPNGDFLFFTTDDTIYMLRNSDRQKFYVAPSYGGWSGAWVLP